MPGVDWFEIPADQPERAIAFYKKAFGWKAKKMKGDMDYWMLTTTTPGKREPGIEGGIATRQMIKTVTNTIGVPSADKAIAKITAAGGKVVVPKMAVQGVGYAAYCTDTEGNTFGIMEYDKKAK